ncbi:structure-specific endonuclease subunit SLX4 isoform X2 [Contarinia nasturtii]|uniref:structure-specific endonuclease subunit SLX4 isoform X2 n=1 Tax=Contarinia nasturtii TaxID=265458 RepID=UPI0012D3FB66|nr:structure-specific endonuclease subunit SLX4 isoform X2 [Contarinia nasturtii]
MDKKDDQKKPNRLKFSRLCLTQTRNAGVLRTNSQLPNSQISRFFSQSNQTSDEIVKTESVASAQCQKDTSLQSAENICDKRESVPIERNGINGSSEITTTKHSSDKTKAKSIHRTMSNDSKSTIKSFFSNEHNDSMADFEIPTKVAKKASKPPVTSKTTKQSRARRKQPDIRKALNKRDDTDTDYSHLPEDAQLELALALSKAESHAATDPIAKKSIDFEAFEFKPKNALANNEDIVEFFNMPKKKNARFKWNSRCTQLTKRIDDVQKMKQRQKVDEFLVDNIKVHSHLSNLSQSASNGQAYEIYSNRLQRICMQERILFEISSCDIHSKNNILSYYTNNLVERSELQAGALLRDWSKIPGRDSIYDCIEYANDKDKTDEPVMHSQPETIENGNILDNQPDDVTEYFDAEKEYSSAPMDIEDIHECEQRQIQKQFEASKNDEQWQEQNQNDVLSSDDDADATIMMESNDIQLKVDAINSKLRLSQNFSDIFQPTVVTLETTHAIRAPSPDLFDDDDDVEMTAEIHEKMTNDQITSDIIRNEDKEEEEDALSDVVLISSSECNSNQQGCFFLFIIQSESIKTTQSSSQVIDSEDTLNNDNVETIELLDSDSENMMKESIPSPINDPENASVFEFNYDICNYEYDNEDFIKPIEIDEERPSTSIKSNENGSITKKLSFTERLEFCDRDVLNGFTGNVPAECLSQIHVQSQESIALSDDEINYSMNKGGVVHVMDDDDLNADNDDYNYNIPSPIDFNLIDVNTNFESDEKLMNQSVCNIFEKTFEHSSSPMSAAAKQKSIGAKSLKKVNSEMMFASCYENTMPSTSTTNRINLMPIKRCKTPDTLPPSQEESRMDLLNDEYFIRVGSISPKPNYEVMDTTMLETELRKFGLKPSLRRRQAIICLEYIYNRTHPIIECDTEIETQPSKTGGKETKDMPNDKDDDNGPKINYNHGFAAHNLVDEKFKKYEENRIFLPSTLRAKKPWCLVPLHIAWHNLMQANSELRTTVLLYKPINLIDLKKFFKTIEMTFDNRDLISFLDMHCITFRMNKASKE